MGIEKILLEKYHSYLSWLNIHETNTSLKLSKIVVNEEARNSGIGTKIMQDLVRYADSNNQIIALTPSSDFGGNKNRLVQFYKKFGFKLNQGYNKNYEFSDTMIRYPKIYEHYNIKQRLREGLITELATGKHLIVVDVQPEYKNNFGKLANNLFQYINENYNNFANITFLYNGESFGMVSESDYRYWLYENGLDEEIAYNIELYDKGYAFFRICIDEGIDDESIINLIKFMWDNKINDSRDLDKNFWETFINEYGNDDIRDLLEFSSDCLNIPDLMDLLYNYNNIVLVGGHSQECLKEVELALDALGKQYQTWNKYTY